MFDNVVYAMTCPFCKAKVDGFQSKDGACELKKILPHEVRTFYSSCPQCDAWVECSYLPPLGVGHIVAEVTRRLPDGESQKAEDRIRVEMEYNPDANQKDNTEELPGA